jgi:inorganic pyrophosphatase
MWSRTCTVRAIPPISRRVAAGLAYPFDWGFIPSTRAMDKDPVDALVLWDIPTFPGVVIKCRALGIVRIEQKGGDRNRIRKRSRAGPAGARQT